MRRQARLEPLGTEAGQPCTAHTAAPRWHSRCWQRRWASRTRTRGLSDHHAHARLLRTMFHVSFRYIFGIPSLILVLLPVASSDCEIKGKGGKEYVNILRVSFDYVNNETHNGSSCLNNESNFFKKHSCDDNKEAMFLFRAARKLKQLERMNNTENFKIHLLRISDGTLALLNCTIKVKERKPPSQGEAQTTRNLEENKQRCLLITLVDKIQTCWNKVFAGQ
ncbi:interleukin-7 [Suncus etruscus]|uniref:interleukin-7 n=1 Tax=Suncus etruscus TaxID=109475 RepID=UPI00210F6119|nr:interleukin-7 [Suncus etruscus]